MGTLPILLGGSSPPLHPEVHSSMVVHGHQSFHHVRLQSIEPGSSPRLVWLHTPNDC